MIDNIAKWRVNYVAYIHQYKYTYCLSEKVWFENLQPLRAFLEKMSSETCKYSNNRYEEVQIYRLITCNFTKIIFCGRNLFRIFNCRKLLFRNFGCKFYEVNFRKAIFKNTFSRAPAVASSEPINLTRQVSMSFLNHFSSGVDMRKILEINLIFKLWSFVSK